MWLHVGPELFTTDNFELVFLYAFALLEFSFHLAGVNELDFSFYLFYLLFVFANSAFGGIIVTLMDLLGLKKKKRNKENTTHYKIALITFFNTKTYIHIYVVR